MDEDRIAFVVMFSLASVIILSVSLILYVSLHDYMLVPLYDIGENMEDSGQIASGWLTDATIVVLEVVPPFVDLLWFVMFVALGGSLIVASYYKQRLSYGQMFGWMILGIPIVLFISSLVFQLTTSLNDALILGVLANLSPQLKYFTFYMTYHGYINALFLVACIVSNFIDFDLSNFYARKEKEKTIVREDVGGGGELV